MTYDEAIACLGTLTNYEQVHQPEVMRQVRLARMRWVCEQLGNPQRAFRSVLVAGTNAKGSISAMIYAMLRCAGLRVGLYTSPHLEDVRERIRVSGDSWEEGADWISPEELATLIERLQPVIEASKTHAEGPVTYFEVITAAALLHFAQRQVRIGVLEVGLGGRLDATNVVEQDVSVFGPIGFDHMDVLGQELAAIAKEKAGIVSKEDVPRGRSARAVVISARQSPEVARVLESAVSSTNQLVSYGRQISSTLLRHEPDGVNLTVQGVRGTYEGLHLPLIGRHQAENAALAVAAVEALSGDGAAYTIVRRGLARVRWPGRCEVIPGEPLVVLDGAHNPQAACALRNTLEDLWPKRAVELLVGMSCDKSAHAIGEHLAPSAASIVCTKSPHSRAADPVELARQLAAYHQRIEVVEDPVDAYTYVVNRAGPEGIVVITGSLFLVGTLREVIARCPL
jgi:dihydrofolate synthase/folylpolyglutamate synthase